MIDNNICPICSAKMNRVFTAKVLAKHEAIYESCADCGLLQAANPSWLEEAYASPINLSDTGIVMRNFLIASKLSNLLHFAFGYRKTQKFVDIAGGYGLLTRLMRDFGFDFYWADKFCQNFVSKGFEYNSSIGQCSAITAIEVLEHVVDPVAFVMESLRAHQADTFIFTTELFEGLPPEPRAWWYYSFETGQHISFFQKRTLERMAKKLNLNFITCNGLHIFSKNRINPVLFYLLTLKIATVTLPWIIRGIRGSKTMPDHYLMLSKKD